MSYKDNYVDNDFVKRSAGKQKITIIPARPLLEVRIIGGGPGIIAQPNQIKTSKAIHNQSKTKQSKDIKAKQNKANKSKMPAIGEPKVFAIG